MGCMRAFRREFGGHIEGFRGLNESWIYGLGCTAPWVLLCGFSTVELFYTYIICPIIHIMRAFTFSVALGIQNTAIFAAYSKTCQCKWPNAGHKIG